MSVQAQSWPFYYPDDGIELEQIGETPYTFPEIVEFCEGLSLDEHFEVYKLAAPFQDHPAGSIVVTNQWGHWIEPRPDHGLVICPKGETFPGKPSFSASAIGCEMCPLSRSRTMVVEGDGRPGGLMVIGEAPGRDEDRTGVPFVGNSGQLLKAYLAELGLPADSYFLTNAVRCHPEDNRDPTREELEACLFWLEAEIDRVKPRAVLALGRIAQGQMNAYLQAHPMTFRVFHAMHPALLLRQPQKRAEWRRQLAEVANYLLEREGPAEGPGEPVWAPGEPDWDSDWLALDTETDSLEDQHAEAVRTIQVSDGERAIAYRPVFDLAGPDGRFRLRHLEARREVGESTPPSVQGEVGPLPGVGWEPYLPHPGLLQLEARRGRDESREPGPEPWRWWQDRAAFRPHPWTGRRVWYHNVRFDAPKLGIDLRDLDCWDDTALIGYVLRYPRVGLKELGPAVASVPMQPITELLRKWVDTTPRRAAGQGSVYERASNKNGGQPFEAQFFTAEGKKRSKRFADMATAEQWIAEQVQLSGKPKKITGHWERTNFSEAMALYPEQAYDYMLRDAVATSHLARQLWPELCREPRLRRYYEEIEKPIVPIVYDLEQAGVLIDNDALTVLTDQLTAAQKAEKDKLDGMLGLDLNPNSGRQLAQALMESGLRLHSKTPTGAWSTDEAALLKLCRADKQADLDLSIAEHYLVNTILQYREYGKLLGTYCKALREKQDERGRIHAHVNQMVCDTNRFSYSDPNLQNIPARGVLGLPFRRCFIAGPGKVIVKADFSQLELRILAHYTRDETLVDAYTATPERDIHAAFAHEWGVDRKTAKNGVFAMAYMSEPETLAKTIGLPQGQIQSFLAAQRVKMPALFGGWKQHIRNLLTIQGYVETLYGWRNYYPLYRSPIRSESEKALREAGNLPIQGTAGGILKKLLLAYDELRREGLVWDSQFVLMVHDEVVFEVPQQWAPQFARLLEHLPETFNPLSVPLKLEVQIGKNWGQVVNWREWRP